MNGGFPLVKKISGMSEFSFFFHVFRNCKRRDIDKRRKDMRMSRMKVLSVDYGAAVIAVVQGPLPFSWKFMMPFLYK